MNNISLAYRAVHRTLSEMKRDRLLDIRNTATMPRRPLSGLEIAFIGALFCLIVYTGLEPTWPFSRLSHKMGAGWLGIGWKCINIGLAWYVLAWVREIPWAVKVRMAMWIIYYCGSFSRQATDPSYLSWLSAVLGIGISIDLLRLVFRPTIYEQQAALKRQVDELTEENQRLRGE